MYSISIGDIQKNISLLTQLTDIFAIIDKRKKQRVAIVYPIKKHSIIGSMAGKYRNRVTPCDDLERAKEIVSKIPSKKERNCIIYSAYLDGYSQIEIANYLGLSKSLISKVIKSGDSTAGVWF